MAPLVLKQLTILLWKSWIMRKRHWISAIFEILFPLFLVIVIVAPYSSNTKGQKIPEPSKDEGWHPATYFDDTLTYSIGNLFQEDIYNYGNNKGPRSAQILYTPKNPFTEKLMKIFAENNPKANVMEATTEEDMFANLTTTDNYRRMFGIVFLNDEKTQNQLNYKIRIKDYVISKVAQVLFPNKYRAGPASSLDSGEAYENDFTDERKAFIKIQIAVNEAYLDFMSNHQRGLTNVSEVVTHKIAYPKYLGNSSGSGFSLVDIVGMMMVTGYVVICPLIVKRITDEKVAKAKEMLRMMGMSDWVFWGSHFINFFAVMLVQSALITFMLFVGFGGLPFFLWSNGFIFFISMILFNISTILSCMLLTTVFNRPVIAVVVSVILFQVSQSVPWSLLNPMFRPAGSGMPSSSLMALTCFLPNMGIQWVITLMGNVELFGHGLTWSNSWQKTQLYGDFTVGYAMLMQFLSIFFYAFLIWYVDNIWPFQFGIPKPFYYPFLPSYWFPTSEKSAAAMESKESMGNTDYFEKEPTFGNVGIKCQNLQKVFNKKTAVSDVSLNIYSGQITVLLGHNGAGKTTTMNMITGIFPPTAGTAYIDGYDVRQQTKKARRSMALCPQENILYNELTVYEHLKLYAVLKDHPWQDIDNEATKILHLIGLDDKRLSLSTELSGGMKRKLSLGIAMIANSHILVLDEPTSGMDPEARRLMWDVLQNIRSQRTILLTTHYMEEADALGDRIAIMSEGSVKCCGTPIFLKKTFGAGYHLRISKSENFKKDRVLTIIRNYMPSAAIKSEIHSEIIYSLESQDENQNSSQNTSSVLAQVFSDLESRKEELNIHSCGLTVTTMEDVFLRVGNEFGDNEMVNKNGRNGSAVSDQERLFQKIPKNYGSSLSIQQFKALFLKRVHHAKRYWPMLVMQTVLPAILFMCILLLDSSLKSSFNSSIINRGLNLQPLYGNTKGFVRFEGPDLETRFKDSYTKAAGSEGVSIERITKNPDNWTIDGKKDTDMTSYVKTYLIGAEINSSKAQGLRLVPWYNKEASHTLPPSITILYQTLLDYLFPGKGASITVHNHPIPDDSFSLSGAESVIVTLIVTCLILIPLTVPFIGASYVLFPIHERVSNSKLLQLMNGLSSFTFWSASYLFDLLNHLVAAIVLFIVFMIFDFNKVFSGTDSSRTALFFMFFLFGFASIPLAYLTSLRLKKPSSGYALLVIIYLITGLILVVAMGILDFMVNTLKSDFMSPSSLEVIMFFTRLLPVFSMSFGIQKIYKVGSYQKVCRDTLPIYLEKKCNSERLRRDDPMWGCCTTKCSATGECYDQMKVLDFNSNGVGIEFTYLIVTGVLYLFILWLIEGNFERIVYFFEKRRKTPTQSTVLPNNSLVLNMATGQYFQQQEDSDVTAEKQRVAALINNRQIQEEAIVVNGLTKSFGKLIPIQAVNQLSFTVHKEECFGLLGVNGAGKTTTFRMLTGDETVSEGNAWIENYGLRQELKEFQKQIGYCPQFDALIDKMTGSETLFMFCRLRGMPEEMIPDYVNDLVDMVDLRKHVNKCTEAYSGGNRRKLSLAIALCAAPPVIFLDEPTSGVDPSARRKIWATLAYLQERYGSAFILTSHSMEECEALCSRLAIMVNGEFQCFGSVQHLRSKFGQGFTIMAKLRRDLVEQSAYMADLQNSIRDMLPSAVLKDVHQCLLHYHITDTSMLWSKMFEVMEVIKTKFMLEDYIVSDTTLEQIFLAFARRQR